MEDPIFDPWHLGDESWPTPSQRTSRWRSASGSTQGVPASRPAPSPIVPVTDDADEASTFVPERIGEEGSEPDASRLAESPDESFVDSSLGDLARVERPVEDKQTEAAPTEEQGSLPSAAEPTPSEETGSEGDRPNRTPVRPEELRVERGEPDDAAARSAAATFLRALLLPRIETITQRLAIARHHTTIDERLGQDAGVLRFRIEPWQGPFDDSDRGREAVLEVLLEGARAERVTGRLWLDPLSRSPSEQTSVPAEEATGTWVDRLLLGFVEKALRQG